jgi:hypothetical protein
MLAALPEDVHHHQNVRSVWGLLTLHPIVLAILTMRIRADLSGMTYLPVLS